MLHTNKINLEEGREIILPSCVMECIAIIGIYGTVVIRKNLGIKVHTNYWLPLTKTQNLHLTNAVNLLLMLVTMGSLGFCLITLFD